jgi:hypothetical protein
VTGRERIEAAFSPDGARDLPAVICYEGIFIRDHWRELTSRPWWHGLLPDLAVQVDLRRDIIERIGQDWFSLPSCPSRAERERLRIEARPEGVFRIDLATGAEKRLDEPVVAGWSPRGGVQSHHPDRLARTTDEIDALIPPVDFEPGRAAAEGRHDLARELLAGPGADLFPLCGVSLPFWRTYHLWGFEGMMAMAVERPDLVQHACRRFTDCALAEVRLAAELGAAGIWLEECMSDMIRPDAFAALNVPFVREVIGLIRELGLKSIYYYCGHPWDRWEHIVSMGADALSFEEGKKGFEIDIERLAEAVDRRAVLLGNLDAVGVLQDGSEEELRAEIARQIAAGRRNGSRFIASLGSPVTPGTPVDRVRLYCDLAHELGAE